MIIYPKRGRPRPAVRTYLTTADTGSPVILVSVHRVMLSTAITLCGLRDADHYLGTPGSSHRLIGCVLGISKGVTRIDDVAVS